MNRLKVGRLARSPRCGGRMDFVDKMQTRQFSQNKDGRRQAREVREDRKWTVRGGVTEHGKGRGLLHLYCCTLPPLVTVQCLPRCFFSLGAKCERGQEQEAGLGTSTLLLTFFFQSGRRYVPGKRREISWFMDAAANCGRQLGRAR